MKADSNILVRGSSNNCTQYGPKLQLVVSPASRCMVETPQAGKNDSSTRESSVMLYGGNTKAMFHNLEPPLRSQADATQLNRQLTC